MKIYETKKTTIVKDVFVKVVCDICEKDIPLNGCRYEVTTGHHQWGNDSIESIENRDICSDECLKKEFEKYLEARSEYYTQYIEIEG